ncbi:hypothetical protein GCM10027022_19660 [Alpinimonas psychrophila]|uniref:Uncharacterized protein n=1 Tax=Alpinimonas psychrophila TaxID=748908 RepID=A0A7W3JUR1_9MICO|nr:hypothetical protein [Alpinimonas psychrophila]MBA8829462.1 hypothetical protein [Alpinimonas psychrophila]
MVVIVSAFIVLVIWAVVGTIVLVARDGYGSVPDAKPPTVEAVPGAPLQVLRE